MLPLKGSENNYEKSRKLINNKIMSIGTYAKYEIIRYFEVFNSD